MRAETRTRDQVADMLFSRRKTLRNDLNNYRVLQEQQPDANISKSEDLQILELISVRCAGNLAAFTEIITTEDLEQIISYMRDLSINGEAVFLLALAGKADELDPEETASLCRNADYRCRMQIDETYGNQRSIYLVGVFKPEFRSLFSPETMFRIAAKACSAKEAARTRKTGGRANEARTGRRDDAEGSAKNSGRSLHLSPARSYIFTPDEKTGCREVI